MARKTYRLSFEIDSAKAEAAARRISAALADVDKAGARAAAGWQRAYDRLGAGGEAVARRVTRAHQESQQKIDIGLHKLQVTGVKFGDTLVVSAEKAKKAQEAMITKGMIGLDALRVKAIKFGDDQVKAAERAAAAAEKLRIAQQKAFEKTVMPIGSLQMSGVKLQDKLVKDDVAARKAAEKEITRSKQEEIRRRREFEAKEVMSISSLQASGLQMQDRLIKEDLANRRAAERERIAKQKAFEKTVLPLSSLQASGMDLQSKIVAEEAKAHAKRQAAAERNTRQLAAIEDRYLRDEYRRRVAYQRQVADAEDAEASRREASLTRTTAAVTAAALAGAGVILKTFRDIRDEALAAADASLALRKALRVEATLKSDKKTADQALVESLAFRAQTGLGQAEATDFTRQFIGSLPVGIQKKNITQKVADELMLKAGVMAARQGGDAGTRGELAGLLAQFGKIESAQQGLGQLEAIRMALTEGRGDDTPLTNQLLKTAGAIVREGGVVESLPEMAALIGITSLSAGEREAGTRTEHIVRGFQAGMTRLRGGKGTKEPQAAYFKRLGIEENFNLEQYLDKIIPDIIKAQKQGRNIGKYLSEHGIKSDEERRALQEIAGVYDIVAPRFQAAREGATVQAGAKVEEANKEFLASTQGRKDVTDATNKITEITRGLPGERYAAALAEAESDPLFQRTQQTLVGRLATNLLGMSQGAFGVLGTSDPSKEGGMLIKEWVVLKRLEQRAKKAGIPASEVERFREETMEKSGPAMFSRDYTSGIERMIEARGGTNAVDVKPSIDRLNATMDENNRLLQQNNQAMRAAPAAGAIPGGGGAVVGKPAPAPLPGP